MKVYLLNDTSTVHAGSLQVMKTFEQKLKHHDIIGRYPVGPSRGSHIVSDDILKQCDAVVINCEGTIHHNSQNGRELLQAARQAKHMGKKVYLLNAVYQDMDDTYNDIIAQADHVCAREPRSHANLLSINPNAKLMPDFCIALDVKVNDKKPINVNSPIIYKSKCHFQAPYKHVFDDFDVPMVSVARTSFQHIVEQYNSADLILTGQHHGVYACAVARTPFVPTSGNTHKIESLIQWSGIPIRVCKNSTQVKEDMLKIINDLEYRKSFELFFDFISDQKVLLNNYLDQIFNIGD